MPSLSTGPNKSLLQVVPRELRTEMNKPTSNRPSSSKWELTPDWLTCTQLELTLREKLSYHHALKLELLNTVKRLVIRLSAHGLLPTGNQPLSVLQPKNVTKLSNAIAKTMLLCKLLQLPMNVISSKWIMDTSNGKKRHQLNVLTQLIRSPTLDLPTVSNLPEFGNTELLISTRTKRDSEVSDTNQIKISQRKASHAWLLISRPLELDQRTAGLIGSKVRPSRLDLILLLTSKFFKTDTSGSLLRVSHAVLMLLTRLLLDSPTARSRRPPTAIPQSLLD